MAAKKTAGFKGPFKAAKSNMPASKNSKTVSVPKAMKHSGKKHDCGCGGRG